MQLLLLLLLERLWLLLLLLLLLLRVLLMICLQVCGVGKERAVLLAAPRALVLGLLAQLVKAPAAHFGPWPRLMICLQVC